jgi:serine/threonine protein kinase
VKRESFNLPEGRTLGSNYDIVEFLGGGWEGEVYKVVERRTGIIRAAKLFYIDQKEKVSPILRYARKLHKLRSCPIIIQYHHRDTARIRGSDIEFLVSDFVAGEMLSKYVNRQSGRRLPLFEALHLLYAVTLGVEQIHFAGEYHGDIHSDNIMVNRRGLNFDVHLIDFLDLGRSTKDKMKDDVIMLADLLYEMIGGPKYYQKSHQILSDIILGRKRGLLYDRYKNAGHLRLALENLDWE